MERKLEGKVAIITGAGSGMGREIALTFARHGAKVVISDINEATVNETKDMITAEGGTVIASKVDMGNTDEVAAMVKNAGDTFGTVDILINNAGIFDGSIGAGEMTLDHWNKVMAVNLTGPVVAISESLKYMLKQHSGKIVNICSIASICATAGGTAYTASKHALLGVTRQLAHQYGKDGIRTNAICPGAVMTGLCPKEVIENPDEVTRPYVEKLLSVPAGRVGVVEDIANAALFLCTDESSFIYGQHLVLDGGWTL